ncbi:MAG: SGNH/GDSL hydrolase family protein [Melioribacter sp.]|nr:SGNH/GDSL hydrolase family protein [Melioribacter sp.]
MKNLITYLVQFFVLLMMLSAFMFTQNAKYKILCFGDSITRGAGVEGNGWVEQVSKMSDKFLMINAGRNGRKTSDTLELVPVLEKHLDANLVLIMLGVNDLKNGNDSLVNLCVSNMKWMITQVKTKLTKAQILLIAPCNISFETMSEINKQKRYNENTYNSLIKLEKEYEKLATEEKVNFISLFNVVSPKNFLDGVHPNIEGHREIAEIIYKKIVDILRL